MSILKIFILSLFSLSPVFAVDYTFHEMVNKGYVRDVEFFNNYIYTLNLNNKVFFISKFNLDTKKYDIEISSDELIEKDLINVEDIIFYNSDLYLVNNNRLINVTNGYTEVVLGDEYDNDKSGMLYRKLYNLIEFNGSLYIGSSSIQVNQRDTVNGTPIVFADGFSELLKLSDDKSSLIRIIDERDYQEKFNFNYLVVTDSIENIWFSYFQKKSLTGGLIKVNSDEELEIIDLESYSNKSYSLRPSSLDIINNQLYINFFPSTESNYLEGISKYDIKNKSWEHSIDFLTNNEQRYLGINWTVPNKMKTLEGGKLAYLSQDLIIENNDSFYYFNITEMQAEKGIKSDNNRNLDLFEFKGSIFIVRVNGILEFNNSLMTNIINGISSEYEYVINNGIIEFSNLELKEYTIYNTSGQNIKSGNVTDRLIIKDLPKEPCFIKINNKVLFKILKVN